MSAEEAHDHLANVAGPRAEIVDATSRRLEDIFLKGEEQDEEAALSLQVERVRLALYGSLAIAGGAITAAWGGQRVPCMPMLQAGLICLVLAVGFAWNGLSWAETVRHRRITRKHLRLASALAATFPSIPRFSERAPAEDAVAQAMRDELAAGNWVRWLTVAAFIGTQAGAVLVLTGVLDSLAKRACWSFTLWPLNMLN